MSDDQDDHALTQAWLAEARLEMADKKLLGTWDATRGDVPVDVSAGPLPVGLRSLSDLAHVLVDLAWVKNSPPYDPADPYADAFRNKVIQQMGADFASGQIVVVAPLGWPPVPCSVPVSAWINLLAEPGGQINLQHTVAYSRLTGEAFGSAYVDQTAAVTDETFEAFNAELTAAVEAARAAPSAPLPDWAPRMGQTVTSWVAHDGLAEAEAVTRIPYRTERGICRALAEMAREVPLVFSSGYPTPGSIGTARNTAQNRASKAKD